MQYRVSYRGSDGFNPGPIGYIIITNLLLVMVTTFFPEMRLHLGLFPLRLINDPLNFWTMFTNLFVHAGIWHFFTNMLTLYFFGNYLIRITGNVKFLVIYFVAGLVGNLFYLWLGEPVSLAIGASGAVFGIAGTLTVLRPKLRVFFMLLPIPIPLWVAVIGGFGLMSLPIIGGNIAWEAHLGGLLVGLLSGYLIRRKQNQIIFYQ